MTHNLFCCSHFTWATIHKLQYISSLWFTTCFGAKSIIISINQFTQATISVARLVIEAIAPALVSSSLFLRHLGNLLSFNIADIIIKSVGTHSELICLGQRVCLRDNTSALARDHQSIGTDQHYIIYLIYHTTYQRELETPKNARVRSVFINTATSWENKHSLHRTAAEDHFVSFDNRRQIARQAEKNKQNDKTLTEWVVELSRNESGFLRRRRYYRGYCHQTNSRSSPLLFPLFSSSNGLTCDI